MIKDINVRIDGRVYQITTSNDTAVYVKDVATGRVIGDAVLYMTKRAGWRWALNIGGKLSSRRARGETLGRIAHEIIVSPRG